MQQQKEEDYQDFNNFFDEQILKLCSNLEKAGKKKARTVLSEIIPDIGDRYRAFNPDHTIINEYCLKKKLIETIEKSKSRLEEHEILSNVILLFQKRCKMGDSPPEKPPKDSHNKDIEQFRMFA